MYLRIQGRQSFRWNVFTYDHVIDDLATLLPSEGIHKLAETALHRTLDFRARHRPDRVQ